jgi:Domain of unknown function (DUF4249)
MKTYIFFATIGLLFFSCYSTTEVDLPNENPFIVVNAVNFQPDSTWLIELSKSESYSKNNDFQFINNALVFIKDENGTEIQLEQTNINGRIFYTSAQKPEAGKQYQLNTFVPGFPEISAISSIPPPIQIESIVIDSTLLREAYDYYSKNGNYGTYEGERINCQIIFSDPHNTRNYYQANLYRETEDSYTDLNGNVVKNFSFFEYYFRLDKDGGIDAMFTDDEKFNGLLYSWSAYLPIEAFYDFKVSSNTDYKLKLHFTLRHLSEEYYQYKKSLELQEIRDSDPFAQPVIVHNNIENGVGFFAGFSQSVFTVTNE